MKELATQMTPARFIREQIFRVYAQSTFAEMLGVAQPTVSRWETGKSPIDQRRIRALAKKRRIKFDANWFYEVPREVA